MRQLVEEVRKLGIVEHAACTTTHKKAAARANTCSKQQELTAVLKHEGRERLEARVLEMERNRQRMMGTRCLLHSGLSASDYIWSERQ